MSFKNMLDVLDYHEEKIALTSDYLDEAHRMALSDSFTIAKRVINNSETISFVSFFDALSTICSSKFDGAYSKYAINFDLSHQNESLCYVIFTKAYPKLSDDQAASKYNELLNKCSSTRNNEHTFNPMKFGSRYVLKWLHRIRPEQKIFLVTAFNDDKIIEIFDLHLLRIASHELIELTTNIMMASAFVVSLENKEDLHPKEVLDKVCTHYTNVITHLSAPLYSILTQTGIAGLTSNDTPILDKLAKDKSIKHARNSLKTVSENNRKEWRQFALENWQNLKKPFNQVSHMALLIKESLDSAKDFKEVTIGDNLNNIKKQALARK